jgi:hypothetical protein
LAGRTQPPVDPTDEIAACHVANEQMQGIRRLVQPTVAQPMIRERALWQVIGLGAGVPGLVVPAAVKMPVAFELRTAWSPTKIACNDLPGRPAVTLHVVESDLVGDALVAQYRDQPIEQRCRIPATNGRMNAFGRRRFTSIVDK